MITPGALLDPPKLQLFDDDGAPAAGYSLYTYEAGTSNPLDTYADSDLTVANSNPIVLDDAGRSTVYLQPSVGYKFVLRDTDGVVVWTQDNVVDLATLLYGYLISTEGSKGVSSGYVITDDDIFVTVNSTGTNPTVITLPAASTRTKPVIIKNIGPNPVSIVRAGADTIEGAVLTSIGLPAASSPLFPTVTLLSDQSSIWWVTNSVGGVTSGGGGGSGGAGIYIASLTLTHAQILALPTTPITVVSAPPAGTRIFPMFATVWANTTSGAYTNIDATYAALEIAYPGIGAWPLTPIVNDATVTKLTDLLGGVNNSHVTLPPYLEGLDAGAVALVGEYNIAIHVDSGSIDGVALQVRIDNNGAGVLTGGNAANTVKIVVYYALEPAG